MVGTPDSPSTSHSPRDSLTSSTSSASGAHAESGDPPRDSPSRSPNRSPAGTRAANTFGSSPGKPFVTITSKGTPPRQDSPRLGASREAQRKAVDDRAITIVERMRDRLRQGRTAPAIRSIDKALTAVSVDQHPRFHWRLLKALAQALIDPATPGDLRDCPGIAQAIQALAQRGWWDPTQTPFLFLLPEHRQALLARCDWSLRAAVLGPDIERQLGNPSASSCVEAHDVVGLLDHMDRLLKDAQEHQDRSCLHQVLDWARRLDSLVKASVAVGAPVPNPLAIASHAGLPDRCTRLIQRCQEALRVQHGT